MAKHMEPRRLGGRKSVLLRARPNLVILPRSEGCRRSYVVKDPISLRYFHLEEPQRFALEQMDGRHTLEDIQRKFENAFRPQQLPLEELEAFASQLLQSGLVENVSASGGQRLFHHHQDQQRRERWQTLINVFYIRFPLLEPGRLLGRFRLPGKLLFHPVTVAGVFVLLLAALGLIVTHWSEFLNRLPTYTDFFTWHTLLYVWLALGLVKVAHELGHGLCCQHVGGQVRETGLAFLFFFPTLYCDVTDIWMLPNKWRRLAVSAAGVYVELLIAALAVFGWWSTEPATFLHNLCFGLVLVCGVHSLLVNANPLMRFDGYFMLSDWVEIPNLAALAGRQVRRTLLEWFGCEELCTGPADPRRGLLVTYGLASIVYRCVILGSFLYLTYVFLKERNLQWLGLMVVVLFLLAVLAIPVWLCARTLRQLGRLPDMKRNKLWLTLGLAFLAILVVGFLPLPMRVRGLALVQVEPAGRSAVVIPKPGGFLDQLLVRDGQHVRQGDVLAILNNPELNIAEQLNDADEGLRQKEQQAYALQLAALTSFLAPSVKTYAEIDHELMALTRQKEMLKAQRDALVLRAQNDGIVMGLPNWESKGKWLKEGTELCAIGDTQTLRAVVLVEPADRQLVQTGATAWFLCHGGGHTGTTGRVQDISQVDMQDIPPQLSSRAGGEVATQPDSTAKQERPCKQHYLVAVQLTSPDPRLHVGALGVVSVDAGSATLWWRARNYLGTTFGWGL